MPKYDYQCKKCQYIFEYRHGIKEKLEKHPDCEEEKCDLHKVPSFFRLMIPIQRKSDQKPGQLVREYIEETKEEVKQEKDKMKKEVES
jgi:putative FmdB family regulatory protein